jgi:hypothetical protein
MRENRLVPLILMLLVAAFAPPGAQAPAEKPGGFSLLVVKERDGSCLARFPAGAGDRFFLSYTHSSDLTPVRDTFRIDERGNILIESEEYLWYGSGLEFQQRPGAQIRFLGKTTRVILNRPMDPFYLRIGRTAGHVLSVNGASCPLAGLAEGGERVRIRVIADGSSERKDSP